MAIDFLGIEKQLPTQNGSAKYFSLKELAKKKASVNTLPYAIRILLENALRNYRLSTRIVRFTNLFTMLIFALIVYNVIESAKGMTTDFGSWFIYTIVGLSIIAPVGMIYYSKKINKS